MPLFQERFSLWPSRLCSPLAWLCLWRWAVRSARVKPSWAAMKLTLRVVGGREGVGGAGQRGGEVAEHVGVAAPEAAGAVAEAVVPFEPGGGEAAELVAAGADVPGLGDEDAVGEEGVGGDGLEGFGVGVEALARAAEDGGEVEAEAVDAGLGDEMSKGIKDQAAGGGVVAGERVAGAGVVDEAAVGGVAEVGLGVEAAEGEGGAVGVAFAGVVEDDVEDGADAGGAEGGDGGAQFLDAAGAEAGVGGEEGDGVVAPGVGEAEGGEVALVDPGGDGHELDGVDAEAGEVVEDRGVGEGGDGAADGRRDVGVEEGEGADGDLVDQAAGLENGGRRGGWRGEILGDRLGHEVGGVGAVGAGGGEAGVEGEGAVEAGGVGVDEEFLGVEPEALGGVPGAVGAEAVAGAGGEWGGGEGVVGAGGEGDAVGLALAVEEAEPEAGGGGGPDAEGGHGKGREFRGLAENADTQPMHNVCTTHAPEYGGLVRFMADSARIEHSVRFERGATAPHSLRGFVRRQIRARLPAPGRRDRRARQAGARGLESDGPGGTPLRLRARALRRTARETQCVSLSGR